MIDRNFNSLAQKTKTREILEIFLIQKIDKNKLWFMFGVEDFLQN